MADQPAVLVLDIDGVCHPLTDKGVAALAKLSDLTARCDRELDLDDSATGEVVDGEFVEPCMHALARAVRVTRAEIVLSSTWRETALQRRAVDGQLRAHGIPAHSGCTPMLPLLEGGRAAEILAWADATQSSKQRWVAIDDNPAVNKLPEGHFVWTDYRTGFTEADADTVIALLNAGER
jgi:hypothetical protein